MFRMTLGLLTVAMLLGCSQDNTVTTDTQSPLGQAVVLLLNNQPAEALALCDSVLEKKADDFDAIMLRGEICESLRDTEGAVVAYEQGAALRPHSSQPHRLIERLRPQGMESLVSETETIAVAMVNLADDATDAFDDSINDAFLSNNSGDDLGDHTSDGLLDGNDKTYRDPTPPAQSNTTVRQRPARRPAPRNDFLARMQAAIAEGQRLDALAANQPFPTGGPARLSDPENPQPEQDRPMQITRFDFGLGLGTTPINIDGTRTTGRRSSTQESLRRQFVSNASRVRPIKARVVDHCQPSRGATFAAIACGRRH